MIGEPGNGTSRFAGQLGPGIGQALSQVTYGLRRLACDADLAECTESTRQSVDLARELAHATVPHRRRA